MKTDLFGQPVRLTHDDALSHWNGVLRGFLAHAAITPEHLGKLLEAEPESAIAHALKGLFLLMLGRRELYTTAQEALSNARQYLPVAADLRETALVTALETYLSDRPEEAIAALEAVLDKRPQDTLAMKLSHAIRFVLGDNRGMRESIERVLPTYDTAHAGHGYLLGCHSFALEETGAYKQAEIAGRQALWTAPDDAWGLHAVAHVYDMTARSKDGLDWLSGREAAWEHCNNFRYHVWWHKALMHLDQGQVDQVLDLYDTKVRNDQTDDYRDISNGTSMLMRLELEGVDIGDRWEEMAELSAKRTEDGCLIFADLHYLLALTGGRRPDAATKMLQRLYRATPQNAVSTTIQRMQSPGQEAASGLCAFGEGDYGKAFIHLNTARASMQLAGGSHAQRDVFERMTIDAGIRAGQLDEAERILDERRAQRSGSEDTYALARRDLITAGRQRTPHSVPAQ